MKKTPIKLLMAEMQKSPAKYASALSLIENMNLLEKEMKFLEDVFEAGYDSNTNYTNTNIFQTFKEYMR